MKVNLAKSAGFCFGVKRAIDIALKTAAYGKKVYMLGDIVHNEDVVKKIEKAGIKKISRLGKGKGKILLIRAHGSSLATLKKAASLGYKIADATCPMVKEIHNTARKADKTGKRVIIIGDSSHDEVRGIAGQLKKKALIIDPAQKIKESDFRNIKNAAVVAQSTQNPKIIFKVVEKLKTRIKRLYFFNTICQPTLMKQEEIRKMPLKNELVFIVGSKKSANTKRLYEISKSYNKNAYWINSKKEINNNWFKGIKRVGVTAGASTPDSTIKEIVEYIKKI